VGGKSLSSSPIAFRTAFFRCISPGIGQPELRDAAVDCGRRRADVDRVFRLTGARVMSPSIRILRPDDGALLRQGQATPTARTPRQVCEPLRLSAARARRARSTAAGILRRRRRVRATDGTACGPRKRGDVTTTP